MSEKFRKVIKITKIFHIEFEAENIKEAQEKTLEELDEDDHAALCGMTRDLRPVDHESEYDLETQCSECGEWYDYFLEICCEVPE